MKGGVSGLYIQEPSGEPGTKQSMLLRGSSVPLISPISYMDAQPAVYVNGVPVADDRAFGYLIKNNTVLAPGTMSNVMASLDLSNVESVEVVKDPLRLAQLGPLAANGAIWINTKDGFYGGKHFTVDANVSAALAPQSVKMSGLADELYFRKDFYPGADYTQFLPSYLKNISDVSGAAPVDWAGRYYNPGLEYNLNATIGNNERFANYLFTIGTTRNAGVAENTSYNKYNIGLHLNVMPFDGFTVNMSALASKSSRGRNKNMRDRFAETEYLPSLSTPFIPTKQNLDAFETLNDDMDDTNDNMLIHGTLRLGYQWRSLKAFVDANFDYTTNTRHVFWPSGIMDNVNYVSDYSGYNRRFYGTGGLSYRLGLGSHIVDLAWTGTVHEDKYHYTYDRGYNGDDDKKQSTNGGGYKQYRYLDQEILHLMSSAFSINYKYGDYAGVGLLVRQDGSTSVGKSCRWLFTPAANAEWNIASTFFQGNTTLTGLRLHASFARIGRISGSDVYGIGPQYNSNNISWANSMMVGSYNGLSTITRPYNTGWIGYYNSWPYSDKIEAGLDGSLWNGRLKWNLAVYNNTEKEMIVPVPGQKESGYQYVYRQGMEIENRGVELTVAGSLVQTHDLSIDLAANVAHNSNKLKKLPGGLTELVIGDRMLKVGEATDMFYLLENKGIDKDNNPVWGAKRMTGHSQPNLFGGLNAKARYKRFDLSLDFYFALGQKAMNYRAYQKYNFYTLDQQQSLSAVKEIFFWRNDDIPMDYPRYNVLSGLDPYRFDQDLYLQNASYMKLRSVTLGYNVKSKRNSVYVYCSATNVFTLSGFVGDDPELVDFDGIYRGYGMAYPRTYTLGIRFAF